MSTCQLAEISSRLVSLHMPSLLVPAWIWPIFWHAQACSRGSVVKLLDCRGEVFSRPCMDVFKQKRVCGVGVLRGLRSRSGFTAVEVFRKYLVGPLCAGWWQSLECVMQPARP